MSTTTFISIHDIDAQQSAGDVLLVLFCVVSCWFLMRRAAFTETRALLSMRKTPPVMASMSKVGGESDNRRLGTNGRQVTARSGDSDHISTGTS